MLIALIITILLCTGVIYFSKRGTENYLNALKSENFLLKREIKELKHKKREYMYTVMDLQAILEFDKEGE